MAGFAQIVEYAATLLYSERFNAPLALVKGGMLQFRLRKVCPGGQCTEKCMPEGVYILERGMELSTSNCLFFFFFLIHKEHAPQNTVKGDQRKLGDRL